MKPRKAFSRTAILVIFALTIPGAAHAQLSAIRAGNWQVGGGLAGGFNSASGFDLDIYPYARYFISTRAAVGLQLRYRKTDMLTHFAYGPTFRYYFVRDHPWAAFVGTDIMFWETKHETGWSDSGGSANFSVGAEYFVGRRTAIGLSLNYHLIDALDADSEQSIQVRGHVSAYF